MKKRTVVAVAWVLLMVGFGVGSALADDAGTTNYGKEGVAADHAFLVDNLRQLTLYDANNKCPCWGSYPWSPDGQWIVYMSNRGSWENPPCTDIYKMRADGTGWQKLTTKGGTHPTFVPPDGSKIVFSRGAPEDSCEGSSALYPEHEEGGGLDVWIMNADGSDAHALTEGEEYGKQGKNKALPSSDGTKIVYHMAGNMYMIDIDGDNPRQVSDLEGAAHYTWGRDTSGIYLLFDAVLGDESGTEDLSEDAPIFPCGSKQVGRSIYRTSPGADLDNSFPEVESLTDGDLDVYGPDGNVIATASGNPAPSYEGGWAAKGENWSAASPDGQWIAFHARYGHYVGEGSPENDSHKYTALRIMRPDGSEKRTLVVKGGELDPTWVSVCAPTSWSPDSQWIAFKMRRAGDKTARLLGPQDANDDDAGGVLPSIFAINIQNGTIVQITDGYDDFRMWWNPTDIGRILFKDWGYSMSRDGNEYVDLLVIDLNETGREFFERGGNLMPVPTLSQWGVLGLVLALGASGVSCVTYRRRRHPA